MSQWEFLDGLEFNNLQGVQSFGTPLARAELV